MFRAFRFFLFALLAASLFTACSGEDGDPGVAGEAGAKGDPGDTGTQGVAGEDAAARNGYFSGTIRGTRRDGTAFEETFNYEYSFGDQVIDSYEIPLQRFETAAGAIADAVATASGQTTVPLDKGYMKLWLFNDPKDGMTPGNLSLYFTKGLSATQLFKLEAKPYQEDAFYDRVIEISPEYNGIYNFDHNALGQVGYFEYYDEKSENVTAYAFQTQSSNVYRTYVYSAETGVLDYVDVDGVQETSGALFDKYSAIKFVYNEELDMHVFVKTSDNSPLYEYVDEVPADVFALTNFTQQSGVISFDFTLQISKYRGFMGSRSPLGPVFVHGQNTTGHDLTITGKFNSGAPVYQEAVGRRAE
jgi:hypothetical protein